MEPPGSSADRNSLDTLLRSVIKVMAISDAPDYEQPWQSEGPTASSGSGCVVQTQRGPRILTNAHCVENQVFIEVRRYGQSRRSTAEVEAIGHECDLALLRVPDPAFFEGTEPIPIGELPHLSDQVSVCGYPIGGDRLSITQGIVSRIELIRYAQSQRRLLGVQIDAAINSGNSGGPVIKDGALVGVAFQTLDSAVRVGHVIAAPVVEHFLQDVEDGIYDGFPGLGCVWQPLDSGAHRRYLGLPEDGSEGVLVTHVVYGSSAWSHVEPGDVILSVDGVDVGCDGTVPLREGELVEFGYVVSERQVGASLPLVIWRDGVRIAMTLPLKAPVVLVAEDRYDVDPSFYVFGGLLFAPLTRDYLRTWGESWWAVAPRDLMNLYEQGIVTPERTEPVVLQKVFADQSNQGYHEYASLLIKSVQGVPVKSLAHLVHLIETCTDDYLRIESHQGACIVLDRVHAMARHEAIMERFGVPHDRSADLHELHDPEPLSESSPSSDAEQPALAHSSSEAPTATAAAISLESQPPAKPQLD
jgi:S1-C subfamily serine protease